MVLDPQLVELVGEWKGVSRLHTPWLSQPIQESVSSATVRPKVNGQFLTFEYSWSYKGERQQGLLIIGCDPRSDAVQAVWTDTWHSHDSLMLCNGRRTDDGTVSFFGTFAVTDHPNWGWRTEISRSPEGFQCTMYNVSPEGEEDVAVETNFVRSS